MSRRAERRQRLEIERRRRRVRTLVLVGGAAVFIATVLILSGPRAPTGSAVTVPTPFPRPRAEGVAMGDPNAPVVMEEFSDFQCPVCRRFSDEIEPQLVEDYVATGKVYFVYRQFPVLGANSIRAAEASLCAAEQGQFWPYHDILFANQNELDPSAFSTSRLATFAQHAGLDVTEFQACMDDNRTQTAMQADLAAARDAGFDATPSFLINGTPLVGLAPYPDYQAAIEAALGDAASGSP